MLATIALAGLAWIVSFATEQVGERFGPAVTGLLQSTLGNLPEFFVVIFALNAGQKIVAETAILGSILVNALFVLGLVIIVGARRTPDKVMRFNPQLPNDTATLLLVSTFIIVLIGLAVGAHDPASHHTKTISIVGAVAILVTYLVWVAQYLRSDPPPKDHDGGARPVVDPAEPRPARARGSRRRRSSRTGSSTPLQPTIHTLHISRTFAGLVIVAIGG